MRRFLLAALMCCLYMHALTTGFKIGTRTRREGKLMHTIIEGKDILRMLFVLGCGLFTAFTVQL